MQYERVPVLVVGAGYAGLSAATLLAWRGIPVMLVERHASTSVQPKAFGVGPRAIELLRPVPGLEERLASVWAGIGDNMRIAIAKSLVDPEPHMIMNDEQEELAFLADVTPARLVGAPQAEIERILRHKAEELGADLRFSTELISLDQDADGVTAVIRGQDGDRLVRAEYVVAADGYRSPLRQMLDVPVSGKGELGRMCSIMFDADLTGLVREREVTLWYLQNDVFTGVIVTGTGVGSHVLGVNHAEGEGDFTERRCVELVRIATGRPDLDVRVLDTASFAMAHVLADTYRAGRVFFAGDAAHTMPPTGGQGGSTALQDGCDLAWRLWLVLTAQAGPAFLDTYDAERRPIGAVTADMQLANLGRRMPPTARIGYPEPLDDPAGVLIGYRYHSTAIIEGPGDDGSILEDPRVPDGRPGSRAPHVTLDRRGRRLSTVDLFGRDFVLLTTAQPWIDAAQLVKTRLGIRLTPILVTDPSTTQREHTEEHPLTDTETRHLTDAGSHSPTDADGHRFTDAQDGHLTDAGSRSLADVEGRFAERYGVRGGGAVLVRPDGYVAWRSRDVVPDPTTALDQALRHILSR
ncbi:FAD-binding protein [Nonomuraea terrae]|uniref:FAD-binding protein n=1 Tax=Nonomuraea terrae TaxID=2530383 RepID=A0A4R4YLK4_9ACTN|nr:FAD-dependent monooxygenase [Nonomuraea terrae]TDD45898.1 FAD-binding protein [Nonomuraea terrae]